MPWHFFKMRTTPGSIILRLPSGAPPTQFTVWRTTDGGASWNPTTTSLSGLTMDGFTTNQIGFTDANHGWLLSVLGVGHEPHLFRPVYHQQWR